MQEGQLLMTQADRDRLVTLRKTKKGLITRRQAAEELGLSLRQVKRQVKALKKRGDKAVVHGLRGKPSNQRIAKAVEEEAIRILSAARRGAGKAQHLFHQIFQPPALLLDEDAVLLHLRRIGGQFA